MKQILHLLAFFLLLFISCGGKQSGNQTPDAEVTVVIPEFPQVVPFEAGVDTVKEMLLSQIADSVQYIPLETNDNCLIRSLNDGNILRTKKYWFLPWIETLFQYTADGKFVRKIGRRGGGPGEYNYIQNIDIDEEKGLVYMLNTARTINVFDMETGKFLYAMKTPSIETASFAMLNDSVAASFILNSNGQRKERIYLSGIKGDTLNTFYRADTFEVKSGTSWMMSSGHDRYLFHYDNLVCYKEFNNDTMFVVTEAELQPRYIFDLGKYSLPTDCRMEACDGDWKKFNEIAAPYIRYRVVETEPYLFMSYSYWAGDKSRNPYLAVYDKKDKSCYQVDGGSIKNDLPGGLPVRPYTSLDNYTLINVYEFEDIQKEAEKNPAVLENEILKKVGEDDNPVLMIVHLKH